MANNFDGYTEIQSHTAARAWNTAMQSVGYVCDFRPLNTEAEADAIYALVQAAEIGEYASNLLKDLSWQIEAEALAADSRDWDNQVSELCGGNG